MFSPKKRIFLLDVLTYRDWLILKNTSTGLGWNDETNTVIADDEWWKKAGEVSHVHKIKLSCG